MQALHEHAPKLHAGAWYAQIETTIELIFYLVE